MKRFLKIITGSFCSCVKKNLIHGLRIDHIDGLFDPKEYLEMLREKLGPDFYIIIEKILEWDEKLTGHWPVAGNQRVWISCLQ